MLTPCQIARCRPESNADPSSRADTPRLIGRAMSTESGPDRLHTCGSGGAGECRICQDDGGFRLNAARQRGGEHIVNQAGRLEQPAQESPLSFLLAVTT